MVNSEWGGVMETFWVVIDFFKSGGFFMYPILLTLALGTAIIIERIIFLSRAWIDGRALWSRIEPDIRAKRLAEAIQQCRESEAALPAVLAAGVGRGADTKSKKKEPEEIEKNI